MHSLKIIILFIFFACRAMANFSALPSSMSFDYFGYKQMTLGNICYGVDGANQGGRPCHPARLANQHNYYSFGTNLEWGLGSQRKSAAEKVLNSDITPELVGDLYNDSTPVLYSGGIEFYYQQPLWSFSISPFKTWYYSHSTNPAYPIVDLHALEEREIQFQVGSAIDSEFLVGTNIKFVSRKFIHQSISIYDLLSKEDALETTEQQVLLFEPGIIWAPETDSEVQPEFNLIISNLGFQDEKYDGFSIDPTVIAGASIGSYYEYFNFRVGIEVEAQNPREEDSYNDLWRAGTVIGNRWLDFTFSGNKTEQSIGLVSKSKYFNSGIIYEFDPERFHFTFNIDI